jgi:hypothetical protein
MSPREKFALQSARHGVSAFENGRLATAVAFVSSLYFLIAAIASHVVNTQYNFFQDYISDYAVGLGGWIFGSAFLGSFVDV